MNTPTYEVPAEMRDMAEKSVDQARKAFEGFVAAAQKAAGQADSTAVSVQTNAKTIGTKAMGFAEANVKNAFDLAQKLVRAKDMQEIFRLQAEYARSQLTTMQEQAKELGSIMQGAAQGAVDSAHTAVDTMTDNG